LGCATFAECYAVCRLAAVAGTAPVARGG
jgi:hypothetical protein